MSLHRLRFPGTRFRKLARRVSPVVSNTLKYVFAEMHYVPGGWYPTKGWNDPQIAQAQEQHWPTLRDNVQGTGPLGVSHLPGHTTRDDIADHNILMSYGYVVALAAHKRDRLSILDWGGGVGHYYLYTRALLPEVELDYHCFDVATLCELGMKLNPAAHMHDDPADFAGKRFDVVISSSSLHYFEEWRDEMRKLAAATRDCLYVARLQVVSRAPSFVVLHKPYRAGYPDLLSWCINRDEFLSCAATFGLSLVREFVFTDTWVIRGAPEEGECRGFLLRRESAGVHTP